MGYESKIIFVERHKYSSGCVYGQEISIWDMCKMGWYEFNGKSFKDIFTIPIDFDLNLNGDVCDEEARIDNYGEHCKYTDVNTIINWLEKYVSKVEYRRADLLLAFCYSLKEQINNNRWNEICVVHYGY